MPAATAFPAPIATIDNRILVDYAEWAAWLIANSRLKVPTDKLDPDSGDFVMKWVADDDVLIANSLEGVTYTRPMVAARLRALCKPSLRGTGPQTAVEALERCGQHTLSIKNLLANIRAHLDHDASHTGFEWGAVRGLFGARNWPITMELTKAFKFEWRDRQLLRLKAGLHRPVPWHADMDPIPDHFVHISTKDPDQVAFTETAKKGERDITTSMKPGRYLQKFYGDKLSKDQIHRIQARVVGDVGVVRFAKTPKEIVDIYVRHATACMRFSADSGQWGYGKHPCEVYGNSDLQLAYMVDMNGNPTARVLVWPDKKLYGRLYGDIHRISAQLRALGYEHKRLDGARIRRVPIKGHEGIYAMPYLDGLHRDDRICSYDIVCDEDGNIDPNWFRIRGPYKTPHCQAGYVHHRDPARCARCNTMRAEVNSYTVSKTKVSWCAACFGRHAFCSALTGEWHAATHRVAYNHHWLGAEAHEKGYATQAEIEHFCFRCEGSHEWYRKGHSHYRPVTMANGQTWCEAYFAVHGGFNANGERVPKSELPPELRQGNLGFGGSTHWLSSTDDIARQYLNSITTNLAAPRPRQRRLPPPPSDYRDDDF